MNAEQSDKDIDGVVRNRLSHLSEVSLRISESLDLDTVLQEVVDEARLLTGAGKSKRCGRTLQTAQGEGGQLPLRGLS